MESPKQYPEKGDTVEVFFGYQWQPATLVTYTRSGAFVRLASGSVVYREREQIRTIKREGKSNDSE